MVSGQCCWKGWRMKKIVPVILSGGSGTRLWPLSRALYPKQLHKLYSENTECFKFTIYLFMILMLIPLKITLGETLQVCDHTYSIFFDSFSEILLRIFKDILINTSLKMISNISSKTTMPILMNPIATADFNQVTST